MGLGLGLGQGQGQGQGQKQNQGHGRDVVECSDGHTVALSKSRRNQSKQNPTKSLGFKPKPTDAQAAMRLQMHNALLAQKHRSTHKAQNLHFFTK